MRLFDVTGAHQMSHFQGTTRKARAEQGVGQFGGVDLSRPVLVQAVEPAVRTRAFVPVLFLLVAIMELQSFSGPGGGQIYFVDRLTSRQARVRHYYPRHRYPA